MSRSARRIAICLVSLLIPLLLLAALARSAAPTLYPSPNERFGFAVTRNDVEVYDVAQLHAGWYLNFDIERDPSHVAGLAYAQMIRLHQLTECWPERTRDREACPYVEPYTYTLRAPTTSRAGIVSAAQANPGSLWLIGSEMDRRDWEGGGQDEMLPQVYARAYHEFYHLIKEADPLARIAIGGVVEPTPLRLLYLDRILDSYEDRYGEPMPVDVWNIHNVILPEKAHSWGAEIPPGLDAEEGAQYTIEDHDDVAIFRRHIVAFRQWMEARGQQEKPLIVTEYGILLSKSFGFDAARVSAFMTATFDYMLDATDAALGHPADGHRLVQRWLWYSLDDHQFEGQPSSSHLFDPQSREIEQLGRDFGDYVVRNGLIVSYRDLRPITLTLAAADGGVLVYGEPATLTLASRIVNQGNTATLSFDVAFADGPRPLDQVVVPGLDARPDGETVVQTTWSAAVTRPHTFGVRADAAHQIDEGREGNNALTATLTVDLAVEGLIGTASFDASDGLADVELTARVANRGDVAVRDASVRFRDVEAEEIIGAVTIDELVPGAVEDVSLTWPQRPVGTDLVEASVDPQGLVIESDEGNNARHAAIPVPAQRVLLPLVTAGR